MRRAGRFLMSRCEGCGADDQSGEFCTQCGAPVAPRDWLLVPQNETVQEWPIEDDEPTRVHPRRPGRKWLVAAIVCAIVAAGAGGLAAGWSIASSIASSTQLPEPEVVEVPVARYATGDEAVMPDVRGLDQNAAREVLADVGIPADLVTITERPAAGAVGVVVEQTPVFGTTNPDSIQLLISTEATVPDIAGKSGSEVSEMLGQLGAQVMLVQRYAPGSSAGDALEVMPAPGSPLPEDVTLVVAEPSSSVLLSELRAVSGGCSSGASSINAQEYDNALSCSGSRPDVTSPTETAWVIARAADRLSGIVGVADNASPAGRVQVDFYGDGVPIASVTAGYGSPSPVDISTSGVLRLSVRVTDLSAPSAGYSSAAAVFGDLILTGGVGSISQLAGS